MESDRFDRLAKSLASVDTRRGLLRLVLSSPLAAGLATRFEAASGQSGNGAIGRVGHATRSAMIPATKNQRQRQRQRRRQRRQDQNPGDLGAGKCVPLLQICVPLVGNPCCDANASCVVSAAGDIAGAPDYACRDNSTTDCASDAECQAWFSNPDVVCRENIGGSLCPPVRRGEANRVRRCCAPKACNDASQCFHGLCCKPWIGPTTCCAAGQFCNRFGGCLAG